MQLVHCVCVRTIIFELFWNEMNRDLVIWHSFFLQTFYQLRCGSSQITLGGTCSECYRDSNSATIHLWNSDLFWKLRSARLRQQCVNGDWAWDAKRQNSTLCRTDTAQPIAKIFGIDHYVSDPSSCAKFCENPSTEAYVSYLMYRIIMLICILLVWIN